MGNNQLGEKESCSNKITHLEVEYKDRQTCMAARVTNLEGHSHIFLQSHWGHAGFFLKFCPARLSNALAVLWCQCSFPWQLILGSPLGCIWILLGFSEDSVLSIIFGVRESFPPLF